MWLCTCKRADICSILHDKHACMANWDEGMSAWHVQKDGVTADLMYGEGDGGGEPEIRSMAPGDRHAWQGEAQGPCRHLPLFPTRSSTPKCLHTLHINQHPRVSCVCSLQ